MPQRRDVLGKQDARAGLDAYGPPIKGMNTSLPPNLIDPHEAVRCENWRISNRGIEIDPGYNAFPFVMGEKHKKIIQHQATDGTLALLLVTNGSVYKYNLVKEQWQYANTGVDTTLSVAAITGAATITVASATGFANGNRIGIILNSGVEHQTTINGAPVGNVITLTDVMPGPAAIGSIVAKGMSLTGNDNNQIVVAFVPWEDWTIFTNGINVPMRFDGLEVGPIPNLPNSGDTVCKTLDVFANHIILYNLIQSGALLPYNLVWCADGDGSNWSTGDSGANSLADARDAIIAAKRLGDEEIIYRSKGLVRMYFIGLPTDPFGFQTINFGESIAAEGVGAVSPNAVFASTDEHIFVSFDGVYRYRGGLTLEKISDKVFYGHFDKNGQISRAQIGRSFVHYIDELDELWLFYPTPSSTFCSHVLVLNRSTLVWRTRVLANEITSAADRFGGVQSVRYVDLVGRMIDQTWTAFSGIVSQATQAILFTSYTGVGVLEYDFLSMDDDGVPIDAVLLTKEFSAADRHSQLGVVHLEYIGGPIELRLVQNGKDILLNELIGEFPLRSVHGIARIRIDTTVNRFQLELSTTVFGTAIAGFGFTSREQRRFAI